MEVMSKKQLKTARNLERSGSSKPKIRHKSFNLLKNNSNSRLGYDKKTIKILNRQRSSQNATALVENSRKL